MHHWIIFVLILIPTNQKFIVTVCRQKESVTENSLLSVSLLLKFWDFLEQREFGAHGDVLRKRDFRVHRYFLEQREWEGFPGSVFHGFLEGSGHNSDYTRPAFPFLFMNKESQQARQGCTFLKYHLVCNQCREVSSSRPA